MLDGYGGINPFAGAPAISPSPYWGWDIARSFVLTVNNPCCSGYVLDGYGGISPMGPNAGAVVAGNYWNNLDVARGLAVRGKWLNYQTGTGAYKACGYYVELYNSATSYSENGAC